jgi:hypothetical protein
VRGRGGIGPVSGFSGALTEKKNWRGILPGLGVPGGLGRIPGWGGLNRTKPYGDHLGHAIIDFQTC